jgi:hypothetical protein
VHAGGWALWRLHPAHPAGLSLRHPSRGRPPRDSGPDPGACVAGGAGGSLRQPPSGDAGLVERRRNGGLRPPTCPSPGGSCGAGPGDRPEGGPGPGGRSLSPKRRGSRGHPECPPPGPPAGGGGSDRYAQSSAGAPPSF